MNHRKIVVFLSLTLFLFSPLSFALEVDREVQPRILLGGRVIATSYYTEGFSPPSKLAGINTEDSALLFGFDKHLYKTGFAGATLGIRDAHDGLYLHQLYTNWWSKNFTLTLGKTRLRNTLIEFPTMRDDDLLLFTHVLNGEDGHHGTTDEHTTDNEEDQLYATSIMLDWHLGGKNHTLGIWSSERAGHGDYNTVGASYIYEQSEDKHYVSWLRHAGLLVDGQNIAHNSQWNISIIGGAEFNLVMNPQHNWSMGIQGIKNQGSGNDIVVTLDHLSDMAQVDYISGVVYLRYTHRPLLLTRWVASLNLAYKDFTGMDEATQWSVIPHIRYLLGQGVEITTQFSYTANDTGLPYRRGIFSAQMGLSFSLDSVIGNGPGERNSILNLEHGYIP